MSRAEFTIRRGLDGKLKFAIEWDGVQKSLSGEPPPIKRFLLTEEQQKLSIDQLVSLCAKEELKPWVPEEKAKTTEELNKNLVKTLVKKPND